jgi:hypothetical protein
LREDRGRDRDAERRCRREVPRRGEQAGSTRDPLRGGALRRN